MLKLNIGYPTREEERKILDAMAKTSPKLDVEAVITKEEILEARQAVDAIHVADPIRDYIVSLVLATRGQHPGGPDLAKFLQFGASRARPSTSPSPPRPGPSCRAATT
jgi:MoxR-like ATPase